MPEPTRCRSTRWCSGTSGCADPRLAPIVRQAYHWFGLSRADIPVDGDRPRLGDELRGAHASKASPRARGRLVPCLRVSQRPRGAVRSRFRHDVVSPVAPDRPGRRPGAEGGPEGVRDPGPRRSRLMRAVGVQFRGLVDTIGWAGSRPGPWRSPTAALWSGRCSWPRRCGSSCSPTSGAGVDSRRSSTTRAVPGPNAFVPGSGSARSSASSRVRGERYRRARATGTGHGRR